MVVAINPSVEEELKAIRAKRQTEREAQDRQKKGWYGLIYCEGKYASIADFNGRGIWLGKTDEVIPYLKKRGVTGENLDSVLLAVEDFRAEKNQEILQEDFGEPRVSKTHSGHSNTKNPQAYIIDQGEKSIVATFRHDPQILRLLETLVARDIGVRTIHSELQKKGYNIPQRTVTRWVSKMRSKELL